MKKFLRLQAVKVSGGAGTAIYAASCPLKLLLEKIGPGLPTLEEADHGSPVGARVLVGLAIHLANVADFQTLTGSDALGFLLLEPEIEWRLANDQKGLARLLSRRPPRQVPVIFVVSGIDQVGSMQNALVALTPKPTASERLARHAEGELPALARDLCAALGPLRGWVEFGRTTLAPRSGALFTFRSVYLASGELLKTHAGRLHDERRALVGDFWQTLDDCFPEWRRVRTGEWTAGRMRGEFIHWSSLVLVAMGKIAAVLSAQGPDWREQLSTVAEIDWRRSNPIWKDRALVNVRLTNNDASALAVLALLKAHFRLPLTPAERRTLPKDS